MFAFILFIFGCCQGSFIALSLTRYYTTDSIFQPRSYCASCHQTLPYWQLIPIVSYLTLKGQCFYCKKNFDNTSFYIELLTGSLVVLLYGLFLLKNTAFSIIILLFFSFWLTFFDLYFYIVEPHILYISSAISLCYQIHLNSFRSLHLSEFFLLLIFFYLFDHYAPNKIGHGDIKLLLSWSLILPSHLLLMTIFLAATLAIIILYLLPEHKTKQGVPFVPFLFLSLLINSLFL